MPMELRSRLNYGENYFKCMIFINFIGLQVVSSFKANKYFYLV